MTQIMYQAHFMLQSVEGMVLLLDSDALGDEPTAQCTQLVTAGSKGVIRAWNSLTSVCVYTQQLPDNSSEEHHSLVDLSWCQKTATLNAVTFDHNIVMYNKSDMTIHKQVGV